MYSLTYHSVRSEKEKFDYDEKKILDYMLTLCKKQGIYENEG